jgi:hydroxymethylpyrimidine pyrophosphatase-like HAD family hydrolase
MKYLALATDYDGTLAQDGHVDEATVVALARLRESGRRALMVTGRELQELQTVCPHLDLFDVIVAENGGVLFWPGNHHEEVLGASVPERFIAEMNRLEVKPFSVGKSIFATWRPHDVAVQETITRLGIDFHIVFNKHAVMVLPKSINKASGMLAALERLKIPPAQVVGIGDAENDFSFLRACGLSAAVANALPIVKQECGLIMQADHGRGVTELIAGLVADDLATLLAEHQQQTTPVQSLLKGSD